MPVFVLHVPTDKLAWAKKEALAHGGELHADALSGSVVLMAPSLPASLETFVPGAAPKAARAVRAAEPVRSFVLDVPFTMRAVAQSLGARWDKDAKALVLPDDDEIVKAIKVTGGGQIVHPGLQG